VSAHGFVPGSSGPSGSFGSFGSAPAAGSVGPVGPIGPHLGERVSAFVDDAMAADARDRALVHMGGCDQCRAEVDAARLMKSRLAALPTPEIPSSLTARLLAMAEPGGPIPPRPGRMPGGPRVSTVPRPAATVPDRPVAGRPQGSRPAGRVQRQSTRSTRRGVRLAALAGAALSTVVVAVVGFSAATGSEPNRAPLTQLTSNVGGTSDPVVDLSRAIRARSRQVTFSPAP
jgi:hypothetical protein